MWFEYGETVQFWIYAIVLVCEVMRARFYELFLLAFEKALRYRVVKVNYVFGSTDWNPME